MKSLIFTTTAVFFLLLTLSCDDDDSNDNCDFVQNDGDQLGRIDETERAIMNYCLATQYTSKVDVKNNIIGEWKLIGYANGSSGTLSQPCASIQISKEVLTFTIQDEQGHRTTTHLWEIVETFQLAGPGFGLKITPGGVEEFYIGHVCENYMFGDATSADGDMYLYAKAK